MGSPPHYLLDMMISGSCCALGLVLFAWARALAPVGKIGVRIAILLAIGITVASALLSVVRIGSRVPNIPYVWIRATGIFAGGCLLYAFLCALVLRITHFHIPERRRFLKIAALSAAAAPVVIGAAAIIRRENLTVHEVDVRIPGLPKDLDGLRLAHLSDIHLSPLVSEALLERAVATANEGRPHIALVTGDLITRTGDPLDKCLSLLSNLKSDVGTLGCLGNHEIYTRAEAYTTQNGSRLGMRFLRNQAIQLRFGSAVLNVAGVDYQRRGYPYLPEAERLVVPGAVNLLLSHNPDVFPVASEKGFQLMVSGHTHGGQVNFEILHPSLNVARFATPYVYGLYEENGRSAYVTRGVGTIGVPARLGAPAEVALIRLCAT